MRLRNIRWSRKVGVTLAYRRNVGVPLVTVRKLPSLHVGVRRGVAKQTHHGDDLALVMKRVRDYM